MRRVRNKNGEEEEEEEEEKKRKRKERDIHEYRHGQTDSKRMREKGKEIDI